MNLAINCYVFELYISLQRKSNYSTSYAISTMCIYIYIRYNTIFHVPDLIQSDQER
jgi:hypothetical protein